MKTRFLATALFVALAGPAVAQPPNVPLTVVVPTLPAPPILAVPTRASQEPPLPLYGVPPVVPDYTPGGVRGLLNRHGLACVSHHSWFGCGNLRSELTFIFGSCRTFFGEPCLPREALDEVLGVEGRPVGRGLGLFARRRGCESCQE